MHAQFKNKQREKQRQKKLVERALQQKLAAATERPLRQRPEETKERRLPAAKRRQIEARQDVEDFAAEYRMLKKVKKGRMSEVRAGLQACMRIFYPSLTFISCEWLARLRSAPTCDGRFLQANWQGCSA